MDVTRAVKIVRYHAKDYRIDENKIALEIGRAHV